MNWTEAWVPSNKFSNSQAKLSNSSLSDQPVAAAALPPGVTAEAFENAQYYEGLDVEAEAVGDGEEDDGDSDAEEQSEREAARGEGGGNIDQDLQNGNGNNSASNRCDLLWQGQLPKRCFTGFKFHESQSAMAARKMMKGRGVGHFWDMLEGADSLLASAAAPSFF